MIVSVVRVLIGFVIACFAASAVLLSFVMTTDLVTGDVDKLGLIGMQLLSTATVTAYFAALFALVVIAVSEWQGIRGWAFYALAGLAIAIAGFIWQYSTEAGGGPTI